MKNNLLGQSFGRLVVIAAAGVNKHRARLWLCRCICGREKTVPASALRMNHTRSCGCWKRDKRKILNTVHGLSHTPEYTAWHDAKYRCICPKMVNWNDYGGR